jgi:peptidoglycan/LPS O-acetylase OafA/YrhL
LNLPLQQKIHFNNLDGLRFIAFFFVFLQHAVFSALKSVPVENKLIKGIENNIFNNGSLGVSFFFVLSGFLITYLLLVEKDKYGIDLKKFYLRRILRIWPLYFLVMLIVIILIPAIQLYFGLDNINKGLNPWPYFLFLSNFQLINNELTGINFASIRDVSWTISVEEQFYLIWPLLLFFFSKRALPVVCLCTIFFSIIFKMYCFSNDLNHAYLSFHTLSVMSDFAFGGLLAWSVLFTDIIKAMENISKKAIISIYVISAIYILLKGVVINFYDYRLIQPLFFCFIIAEQNFAKNSFYKIGNNKMMTDLGQISFGLYLFHALTYFFLDYLFRYMNIYSETFIPLFSMGILSFLLTIILARLSYIYFEQPFLRIKKNLAVV